MEEKQRKAMVRAFNAGIGACNDCRPHIDVLAKIGEADPTYALKAEQLKSKLDCLESVCNIGVEAYG